MASMAYAEPVKHAQCYTSDELTTLDKENVAGGKVATKLLTQMQSKKLDL